MKIPFYKPSSDHLTELVRIYISERDWDPHPAGPMRTKMVRMVEAAHREERAKAEQERVRAVEAAHREERAKAEQEIARAVEEIEKRAAKKEGWKEVKRIQRQLAEVT